MLLNITNHPSSEWQQKQLKAAEAFGGVVDLPLPSVEPSASEEQIQVIAGQTFDKAMELHPTAVLVAGEYNLVFLLVDAFLSCGVKVVAGTTRRKTSEVFQADGSVIKTSMYDFVRFREYRHFG